MPPRERTRKGATDVPVPCDRCVGILVSTEGVPMSFPTYRTVSAHTNGRRDRTTARAGAGT